MHLRNLQPIAAVAKRALLSCAQAPGSFLPVHCGRDQSCTSSDGHDQHGNERFDLVHSGLRSGEGAQRHEAANDGTENQDEGEEGSHWSILAYEKNVVTFSSDVRVNDRVAAQLAFSEAR